MIIWDIINQLSQNDINRIFIKITYLTSWKINMCLIH